jgi:oligopeptidase B
MRGWPATLVFLIVPALSGGAAAQAGAEPAGIAAESQGDQIKPPVAARKPARLTAHGITRVDEYGWLRDPNWREVMRNPSRLSPEIAAHLAAENGYSDAVFAPLADLRARLVQDMKGRIEQEDSGVPLRDGEYAYWRRFVRGAEHPQIMRSRADGSGEEVLLDGSTLAAGKPYFSFGDTQHSPNHRLLAY